MQPKNIYMIGICGTGTGSLAGMLKDMGHLVRGSDAHVYPPMSQRLASWGIEILNGYDASRIQSDIDLIIVGNVIRRDNPEATAAREAGLPTMSMPQAIAHFCIEQRHSIVIAGTHGKTTTTALTAHLLLHAGCDPGYLIGGAPIGQPTSFHKGKGPLFVVEGDEYDTAYFDKGPKFLHYRAKTAVITSLEFDHADIFDDVHGVETAFARLIQQLPTDARLVVWHGASRARKLIESSAKCQDIYTFSDEPSLADEVDIGVRHWRTTAEGLEFEPHVRGQSLGTCRTSLWGALGVRNALAAIGAITSAKLSPEQIRRAFQAFQGVHRRMEIRGQVRGVTVVDDFAHHPTAVAETLKAARMRWPHKRIWAIFEPRSATARRNIFDDAYTSSFRLADRVIISGHPRLTEVALEARFSPHHLAERIGPQALAVDNAEAIRERLIEQLRENDVVLVLSNGSFDGLIERLLQSLAEEPLRGLG